jgi:Transposase IS200 like
LEITKRCEIVFLEIGTDKKPVAFLLQSGPTYSPTKIARTGKSLTARFVVAPGPEVKKQLWGGKLWGKGYFINTVGQSVAEFCLTLKGRTSAQECLLQRSAGIARGNDNPIAGTYCEKNPLDVSSMEAATTSSASEHLTSKV